MPSFIEHFPQAYHEWVVAGGIENNFRAHALAIGLCKLTLADLKFMEQHTGTANRQFDQVQDSFLGIPLQDPAPGTFTGRAADISYLTGEIDTAFCNMLRGLCVDLVVVGLQDIDLARRQLAILQSAGFRLHAYVWPCNKDLDDYIPEVHSIMTFFKLPYIWVDVEESSINVIESLARLCPHPEFRVGIYTSASMWLELMANTVTFSHLPLWYARWDYKADMSDFVPFGGWRTAVMKQYDATDPRFDYDVYDPAILL